MFPGMNLGIYAVEFLLIVRLDQLHQNFKSLKIVLIKKEGIQGLPDGIPSYAYKELLTCKHQEASSLTDPMLCHLYSCGLLCF